MASFLSLREEPPAIPGSANRLVDQTQELEQLFGADNPFRVHVQTDTLALNAKPVDGTRYLALTTTAIEEHPAPSIVHGVSLSSILQMLHLERKTCVLEVVADQCFGTITMVNGELVDADVDDLEGESAVYRILSWQHPDTTIMDGVSLFRHTVNLPMNKLLVEAVRLQDEASGVESLTSTVAPPRPQSEGSRIEDWNWLVESLMIGGARIAAVIRAQDETVLAIRDEFGGARNVDPDASTRLTAIARSARRWSRMVDTGVSEMVMRIGDDQLLIAPLDAGRTVFAYVQLNCNDSLEFVRGAIRSVIR